MSSFNFTQVNDEDKSLQSKAGGKFGLNEAKFSLLGYNDKAGKDNTEGDAFDINIMVGEKEFRTRIFDITGALYGKQGMVEPGKEGYEALYNSQMLQNTAVIKHAVRATGVATEVIDKALEAAKPADFVSYCQVMTSLVPKNYKEISIYVFLEYQWNIGEGNDRTYLVLPKNMKGGHFLAVKKQGEIVESKENGLSYSYKEGGIIFERDTNYMESNKANQQFTKSSSESSIDSKTAVKSEW